MIIDIQVELNEVRCAFCRDIFTHLGIIPEKDYFNQGPARLSIVRKTAPGSFRPAYTIDGDVGPAALWEKAQAQGWTEITVFDTKLIACPTCQKKKVQL
jgi:hypothetical protein